MVRKFRLPRCCAGIGVAFFLASGAAPGGELPSARFAPAQCPYAVVFPVPVSISQSSEGEKRNISADLVIGEARFAAACITASNAGAVQSPTDNAARTVQMASAIGLVDAEIRPLDTACSEIRGGLGGTDRSFRVEARICFAAASTFIAEVIYRSGGDEVPTRQFLDSVVPQ